MEKNLAGIEPFVGCSANFTEIYQQHLNNLRQIVANKPERVSTLNYDDLDWRLEAEVIFFTRFSLISYISLV